MQFYGLKKIHDEHINASIERNSKTQRVRINWEWKSKTHDHFLPQKHTKN